MRITDGMIAARTLQSIQKNLEKGDQLQQQSSTGLRIVNPSDDPTGAQRIAFYREKTSANTQFTRNVEMASSLVTQIDSTVGSMYNVITRAREIAVAMASDTNNINTRAAAMVEVKQLKDQMVSLGNTQIAGKYIFGGFRNDQPPFDSAAINIPGDPRNGTSTGTFTGTDDEIKIEVDTGISVSVGYSGGNLIRGGTPPGSTGTDMITAFDNLITSLAANTSPAIRATLDQFDGALSQLSIARGEMGARMNRLESIQGNLTSIGDNITKVKAQIQDVDYMQVISDLSLQKTAYESILQSSAMISQMSLMDYLK